MATSTTKQFVFEEIDFWHRRTMFRLNSVEILYAHYRQRIPNDWASTVGQNVRSVRDQLAADPELPAWIRRYFSSVAGEEMITFAGVSGTSALDVVFKLTDRMLSVGVTESFIGFLKPLDTLVPLIALVRREFERVRELLNDVADPNTVIANSDGKATMSGKPPSRPRVSKSRNLRKAHIQALLRGGVFPGKIAKDRG